MGELVALGDGASGYLTRNAGSRGVVVAGGSRGLRLEACRALDLEELVILAVGGVSAGELIAAAKWLRSMLTIGPIGVVAAEAAATGALALAKVQPVPALALLDPPGLHELGDADGALGALQAHFPGSGPRLSSASIREEEDRLIQRGLEAEFFVYPGAVPGFLDPKGPEYGRLAARQVWERVEIFILEALDTPR